VYSPVIMANDKVEQLATNRLTIPQDAIASLLQRLVRPSRWGHALRLTLQGQL